MAAFPEQQYLKATIGDVVTLVVWCYIVYLTTRFLDKSQYTGMEIAPKVYFVVDVLIIMHIFVVCARTVYGWGGVFIGFVTSLLIGLLLTIALYFIVITMIIVFAVIIINAITDTLLLYSFFMKLCENRIDEITLIETMNYYHKLGKNKKG